VQTFEIAPNSNNNKTEVELPKKHTKQSLSTNPSKSNNNKIIDTNNNNTDFKRKIRQVKDQLNNAAKDQLNGSNKGSYQQQQNHQQDSDSSLSVRELNQLYQIANELMMKKSGGDKGDKDDETTQTTNYHHRSELAEQINAEKKKKNKDDGDDENENEDEGKEGRDHLVEQNAFRILTGVETTNDPQASIVSYKKMLDYVAKTMNFKVIYQSLLGRDGSVFSYVNLSVLPTTDRPLKGQGSTHIESSNRAALNALEYLASKCTTNNTVSNTRTNSKSNTPSFNKGISLND